MKEKKISHFSIFKQYINFIKKPCDHQLDASSYGFSWRVGLTEAWWKSGPEWCVFSSGFWSCVNQHCTTVNVLWLLKLNFLFLVLFFQPWPPYYPTTIDVPSWPKLPTDNQCPSLTHPTHLSFIFSLVKCLHLVKTSISSSLNLYFSAKTFLLSNQTSTSWQNFYVLLVKPLTFDKTSIFS